MSMSVVYTLYMGSTMNWISGEMAKIGHHFWKIDVIKKSLYKKCFGYVDFYSKTFLISYPLLENSTTGIAIVPMIIIKKCFAKNSLFLSCQHACKNWSKYKNTTFLLVQIQIWIKFLEADMMKKVTSYENTSL